MNSLGQQPVVPLEALQAGESGIVWEIEGAGPGVNHLREIGLRAGNRIRMLRPGPPHLLLVGEARLCIRPDAEVLVLVAPDPVNA